MNPQQRGEAQAARRFCAEWDWTEPSDAHGCHLHMELNHLHGYGYTWMLRQVNSGMILDQGYSVSE